MDTDVVDKALLISGVHSCGLLKSSPIASGVVQTWRIWRSRRCLRAQNVFQEEEAERLDGFGEFHRKAWRHALVNIVQQFDFFAELLYELFEQAGSPGECRRRARRRRPWCNAGDCFAERARAVARHAGHPDLHAHVAEALLHEFAGLIDALLRYRAPAACV